MSDAVQYTIVGVIILAAIVWAIVKITRISKNKGSACCGCGLADTCNKNRKNQGDCPERTREL